MGWQLGSWDDLALGRRQMRFVSGVESCSEIRQSTVRNGEGPGPSPGSAIWGNSEPRRSSCRAREAPSQQGGKGMGSACRVGLELRQGHTG